MSHNQFSRGFESWHETHFEVVDAIFTQLNNPYSRASHVQDTMGRGGLYELAQELTDKFEQQFADAQWDGNFFDELDSFLENELKPVVA